MGERGGFIKYGRKSITHLPEGERIKNWEEFNVGQSVEDTRNQAARCMECGTPFCHSGEQIGNAVSGCPLHSLIPEWNDMVYRGLWKEAYQRLVKTTDFPEFTGRVCPALCEGSCTAGLNGDPVTIRNNENEIIERAFREGWVVPVPPTFRTGKKVAVVGSGPAGLTCANQLNRYGHAVTVFERDNRPGGLLMYGIPNMKIDKQKVVLRRIDILEREGIKFITGCDAGKNMSAGDLDEKFDAVVMCTGSKKPRGLNIKGSDLKGIYYAVDFLSGCAKSMLFHDCGDRISIYGRNVAVIGGGDTGTDCVAASIRLGCKSVVQLEIMQKPPICRQAENPWPEWPRVHKVDYGQEEAIELFGKDPRQYLVKPVEIIGGASAEAVMIADVQWTSDEKGIRYPMEIKGSLRKLKAETVLLAMGFTGTEDYIFDEFKLERDNRDNIKADPGTYQTNIANIFAAGDARRGQSLVVWAMQEGRKAAAGVNEYLKGQR